MNNLQKLNCPKCNVALNRQADYPKVFWCDECDRWFDSSLKSVPGLNETNKSRWRWYILAGITFAVFVITIALNWLLLQDHAWEARSSFGDMFGVANAIFSGLAFAALIVTLLMQKEELELQRSELQDTRTELTRTAEAQEKSEKALNDQLQELIKQRQLSVMPAFTLDLSNPGASNQKLHNIGNGTALNIRLRSEEWNLPPLTYTGNPIRVKPIFYPLNFIPHGENRLCLISNIGEDHSNIGKDQGQRLQGAVNEYFRVGSYELYIEFQDIEGTAYKQILRMNKGNCVP